MLANMDAMSSLTSTATAAGAFAAPRVWAPPTGARVRGVIALLAGAAEAPRVYERFGRRLSADGYTVAVFDATQADAATTWLGRQEHAPRVLAGSDRGATAALTEAARGASVDGVVVAATPVGGADDASAAPEQRSACPLHLGVLAEPAARAAASAAPDSSTPIVVPERADLAAIAVPVLAIHGGADPIAPLAAVRDVLAAVPDIELVETVDGLHDALNDQSHRSVAATIVLWLERLRAAGVDRPIVREVAL